VYVSPASRLGVSTSAQSSSRWRTCRWRCSLSAFAEPHVDRGKPVDEGLGQSEPALSPSGHWNPQEEPPVGLLASSHG
jgi:hypothetical protein